MMNSDIKMINGKQNSQSNITMKKSKMIKISLISSLNDQNVFKSNKKSLANRIFSKLKNLNSKNFIKLMVYFSCYFFIIVFNKFLSSKIDQKLSNKIIDLKNT